MSSPDSPASATPRGVAAGEWLLVAGLGATLTWTTLCLGGYLAKTMVVTSWAVFGLVALGALLWAVGPRRFHLAALLPVPFLAYALVSVLWLAPAPWLAWREWLLWFQMWLVFVLVLHFGRGRAQTWTLAGVLVALGLVGTAMAAYQRFGNHTWMMLGRVQVEQFTGRSAGMFGIPNSLAGLLELMTPVCLLLLFSRAARPAARLTAGWLAGLFLFAIILTGSRGGWIGLGLALLAWPLLGGSDWRRKLAGLGAVALAAVLLLGLLHRFSDYARGRMEPFLEGRFEPSRPIIWKAGWRMWQEAPWLGRGAGAYNVLFEQYRPVGFWDTPEWTHNDYLNTLCDYGLLGGALWAGAGVGVFGLGWAAVRRAKQAGRAGTGLTAHWRWRLGLWLGLAAFALHLAVDFHTKIPALAFAAACVAALLVRDEEGWWRTVGRGTGWCLGAGLAMAVLGFGWWIAAPLYRAEALRFAARESFDHYALTKQGDLTVIIPRAKDALTRAVRIDPRNGQAWGDLAYATVQMWHAGNKDSVTLGRFAELAANEALKRCPVSAEFWVRKGVALDLQRGRPETESCYRRALELAPNLATYWFYYAYHLQAFPNRKADAIRAVETCLTLDRSYPGGESLRQQLTSRP